MNNVSIPVPPDSYVLTNNLDKDGQPIILYGNTDIKCYLDNTSGNGIYCTTNGPPDRTQPPNLNVIWKEGDECTVLEKNTNACVFNPIGNNCSGIIGTLNGEMICKNIKGVPY